MSENPQQPQDGGAPQLTEEEMAYVLSLFDMAREGDTLLILAAYHQHEDTVAALLEAGADPDRVNDNGQTALLSAVFRGHEGIVRRLLAAGASQTAGAHSATDFATVFERADLIPVLEEYAAR